jgi:hypothetical protein
MKRAKLFGLTDGKPVGSVTLPHADYYPKLIQLYEGVPGGHRLFLHVREDRYEEVDARPPVVELDPLGPESAGEIPEQPGP